jgi:hypothetical protein
MTSIKMGKNLNAVISGLAVGLTIFLAAHFASAETNTTRQDSAGWYETEDSLPVIHHQYAEKIVKDSERAYVTTGNNLVHSWYGTEDALPFSGIQNSKGSAQKGSAERYVNRVDLWAETEDALPKL